MKKLFFSSLGVLLMLGAFLLVFTACNNDDEAARDFNAEDTEVLVDNIAAEGAFEEAFTLSMSATEFRLGGRPEGEATDKDGEMNEEEIFGTCADITVEDLEPTGKKLTIDFGDEGCTGFDGKTRKGKIIVTASARYFVPGSVVSTTFDNYFVNGVKVEGTKTVTNITEQGGDPTHTYVVDGGKLTFPNNTTIEWETNRTRVWDTGHETFIQRVNPFDDVFRVSGTYSGKNRDNVTYTMETTQDLVFKSECWLQGTGAPVEGKVEVDPSNFFTYEVDYSPANDGACDNTYSVTIGNQTIIING